MAARSHRPIQAICFGLFTVWLVLAGSVAAAATLTASLDRNPIMEGESFQLVLEVDERLGGKPDLTPLEKDFDVLRQSSGSSMQMANGDVTMTSSVTLSLMAKRAGDLTIPAIRWGALSSQPIALKVQSAEDLVEPGGKPDLFIESTIDRSTTWQQAQVVYVARLHTAVQILNGSLSEPASEDVIIEGLGDDRRYRKQIDGRQYDVIERRWAIFPQKSGKVELAPVVFSGEISDRGRQASLFGRRQVRVPGKPFELEVLPPVKGETPWLPSWQITLADQWSEQNEIVAGEPVTRTVRLTALGLPGSQLPELQIPSTDGLKVYPDKPEIESSPSRNHLTGRRTEKFALVATRPGTLDIPEMRLRWWDSRQGIVREAVLPGRQFTVLPAPVTSSNESVPEIEPANNDLVVVPQVVVEQSGVWRWLAVGAFLLWVLTVLLWAFQSKRTRRDAERAAAEPPVSLRQAKRVVTAACEAGDAMAAERALIDYARELHGCSGAAAASSAPRNLSALAAVVEGDELKAEILTLDRVRYAGSATAWDGASLKAMLNRMAIRQSAENNASSAALPALYLR